MYQITVNPNRSIGSIDPKIYGHFTEHAFANIQGGFFDPGHARSDELGLRRDVVECLREVKVPILRYPGGNFVSNYHWEDGVGPRAERKKRFEYAWGAVEDNQFGTAEFIQLCRATGAAPYLCCNMGTGTLDEAMNWVEYCNSDRPTHYADLRREHGFEAPFGVRYWGLGNECYGPWQMGAMDARDYAKKAMEFGKAIRFADPGAHLIACGFESDPAWNIEVVRELQHLVDGISVHHYSVDWGCFDLDDYLQLMSISQFVDELIKRVRAVIEGVTGDIEHPMKVSLDEWNMFGWLNPRVDDDRFYTLENAIVTASILNTLIRNCRVVDMANYSTFVNINGALHTTGTGLVRRPQYYVFKLFTHHMGKVLVDSEVVGEQFETEMPIDRRVSRNYLNEAAVEKGGRRRTGIETGVRRSLNYLDSVATTDAGRREIALSLVNKHPEHDLECAVDLAGGVELRGAELHTLWSAHLDDSNTEDGERVRPADPQPVRAGGSVRLCIPRHSVNVLKMRY